MSLNFITNNPVKIATCLLLESREVLRSYSAILQGCNSRGLDPTIHIPVFPCSSHLALPPSTGISLQHPTKHDPHTFPVPWFGTRPSQPHRCALALQHRSSLLQFPAEAKGSASQKKLAKSLRIAVPSVSQSSQRSSPRAHVAGKPQAPPQLRV